MAMDSSSAKSHHQEIIGSQTLESMLVCTKPQQEKKPKPADQQALKCPRCDSINTKFCYYNNYSLSQPRYFCKSCRRYWTKGGTLRNVPVGGGCRKNRRSSSSSSSSSSYSSNSSSKRSQDQSIMTTISSPIPSFTPNLSYNDHLSLAIARLQKQTAGQLGLDHDHNDFSMSENPNSNTSAGLFDAFRGGFLETPIRGFHNMYSGLMGDGISLGLENGGMGIISGISQEMGFEELNGPTAMKQEMCSNGREGESKGLWGFPWQNINGGDIGNMGELSWTSNLHGLLNI